MPTDVVVVATAATAAPTHIHVNRDASLCHIVRCRPFVRPTRTLNNGFQSHCPGEPHTHTHTRIIHVYNTHAHHHARRVLHTHAHARTRVPSEMCVCVCATQFGRLRRSEFLWGAVFFARVCTRVAAEAAVLRSGAQGFGAEYTRSLARSNRHTLGPHDLYK